MHDVPQPRELLDSKAANRFTHDQPLVRKVLHCLKAMETPASLTLLPVTSAGLVGCSYNRNSPAAVLLASSLFDVQGFSLTPRGLGWTGPGRVPVLARPFAYLSHLLRMDWRDVVLLFGPACPNDILMHQWEPFPKTAHALITYRLQHYLQHDGNPVTPL
jgi:hypothetical protein